MSEVTDVWQVFLVLTGFSQTGRAPLWILFGYLIIWHSVEICFSGVFLYDIFGKPQIDHLNTCVLLAGMFRGINLSDYRVITFFIVFESMV